MSSEGIMKGAILEHEPVKVWALYSGGHDSFTATHVAMGLGAEEVLHIKTGTGVRETEEVVRENCRAQGWPLRVESPPGLTYREYVRRFGMPGPGSHRWVYIWLKERAIRKVVRESKRSARDRVMLCTGVRRSESARRMGHLEEIHRVGCQVWVAPIFEFSKLDCTDYMERHGLPRSPVVDLLHMSGECLCGAFAHPGEMKEIEMWYPAAAAELHACEEIARAAGKPCVWGVRPLGGRRKRKAKFMPLCVGCDALEIK